MDHIVFYHPRWSVDSDVLSCQTLHASHSSTREFQSKPGGPRSLVGFIFGLNFHPRLRLSPFDLSLIVFALNHGSTQCISPITTELINQQVSTSPRDKNTGYSYANEVYIRTYCQWYRVLKTTVVVGTMKKKKTYSTRSNKKQLASCNTPSGMSQVERSFC